LLVFCLFQHLSPSLMANFTGVSQAFLSMDLMYFEHNKHD